MVDYWDVKQLAEVVLEIGAPDDVANAAHRLVADRKGCDLKDVRTVMSFLDDKDVGEAQDSFDRALTMIEYFDDKEKNHG